MAILLIWAFFQLIAPKLSGMIASVVHPIRTETAVSLEKSLLAKSIDTETAKELGRQYDLILGAGHRGTDADMNTPERKKWDAAKSDIEQSARDRKAQEIGRIDETYRQEKRRQQTLAVNISLISPSAAFARLIADVCGTGEVERTKYVEAVLAYQKALDSELFSKVKRTIMIHPSGGTTHGVHDAARGFQEAAEIFHGAVVARGGFQSQWKQPGLARVLAGRAVRGRLCPIPEIRRPMRTV